MKIVDEAKLAIFKGIEEERARVNANLDNEKENISKMNNIPTLLSQLIEVYGNTSKQYEKMEEILKGYLEANFFTNVYEGLKGYSISGGGNFLYYKHEEFYVGFSGTRTKVITIGRNSTLKEPSKPSPSRVLESQQLYDFLKSWETYKADGSDENYLLAINAYSRLTLGRESTYFLRRTMLKEKTKQTDLIEKYVISVNNELSDYKKSIKLWEKDLEDYNSGKEELYKELSEVNEDLKNFQKEGWRIEYKNLNTILKEKDEYKEKSQFKLN